MATKTGLTSQATTNHEQIRQWAEARGAEPACVRGTGNKHHVGMLRLDFPGHTGEDRLEHISWEDRFVRFDERQLGPPAENAA